MTCAVTMTKPQMKRVSVPSPRARSCRTAARRQIAVDDASRSRRPTGCVAVTKNPDGLTQADFKGRTHDCPGGCGRQVAQISYACKKCWFRLPKSIRDTIWRGYKGSSTEHRAGMSMAHDWYKENPLDD